MGGKGGVGKTSVMAALAEWFDVNDIPVKLLDLDTENKARGSLTHFFSGRGLVLNNVLNPAADVFQRADQSDYSPAASEKVRS